LSYKNPEEIFCENSKNSNGIKIEIKERPMLHDNNAFQKRPNTSKSIRNNSLKHNNNNNCKNKEEIKQKIFKTTKEDPFLHKNFTEIPD